MEVIVRTQDGKMYKEFALPLEVYLYLGGSYVISMNNDIIGEYKEEKHAIHAMNFLLAKRNYYLYDAPSTIKSVILNVPTDEAVRETPDEDLLNGIPVKENSKESDNL